MAFHLTFSNPIATAVLLKRLTSYSYGQDVDGEILAAMNAGANIWATNTQSESVFFLLLNRHPNPQSMDLWLKMAAKSIGRKPWKQQQHHPLHTCLEETSQPDMWTNQAIAKLVAIGCPVDDFDTSDKSDGFLNRLIDGELNRHTWEAWTTLLIQQPQRETDHVARASIGKGTALEILMQRAPLDEIERYFQARNEPHDWTKHLGLAGRITELLEGGQAETWKSRGFDFLAQDARGNTLLHHYFQKLQSQVSPSGEPWQMRIQTKTVIGLLEQGVTWTQRNIEGVSPGQILLADDTFKHAQMKSLAHLARQAALEEALPPAPTTPVRTRL